MTKSFDDFMEHNAPEKPTTTSSNEINLNKVRDISNKSAIKSSLGDLAKNNNWRDIYNVAAVIANEQAQEEAKNGKRSFFNGPTSKKALRTRTADIYNDLSDILTDGNGREFGYDPDDILGINGEGMKTWRGISEGLDNLYGGLGEGIDWAFDNSVGSLAGMLFGDNAGEKVRNLATGDQISWIPEVGLDLALLAATGGAAAPIVALGGVANNYDNFARALSGIDQTSGQELNDTQRGISTLAGLTGTALSVIPGTSAARGATKASGKAAQKLIADKAGRNIVPEGISDTALKSLDDKILDIPALKKALDVPSGAIPDHSVFPRNMGNPDPLTNDDLVKLINDANESLAKSGRITRPATEDELAKLEQDMSKYQFSAGKKGFDKDTQTPHDWEAEARDWYARGDAAANNSGYDDALRNLTSTRDDVNRAISAAKEVEPNVENVVRENLITPVLKNPAEFLDKVNRFDNVFRGGPFSNFGSRLNAAEREALAEVSPYRKAISAIRENPNSAEAYGNLWRQISPRGFFGNVAQDFKKGEGAKGVGKLLEGASASPRAAVGSALGLTNALLQNSANLGADSQNVFEDSMDLFSSPQGFASLLALLGIGVGSRVPRYQAANMKARGISPAARKGIMADLAAANMREQLPSWDEEALAEIYYMIQQGKDPETAKKLAKKRSSAASSQSSESEDKEGSK